MSTDVIGDAVEDRVQNDLVTGAVGSRCANCQAPMASDQRYCLNCGERRGKPRFGAAALAAPAPALASASTAGPGERHPRSRMSSATTLVAGVATLLIALGVGVLIGHDSNSPQRSGYQVLTVGGGSGTSTNAASPGTTTPSSAAGRASTKHTKVVTVHLTPKLQQKAANAATKVFGASGNLSKNVTQKVNSSCSGGAGCQNGKFTGNFFSGG